MWIERLLAERIRHGSLEIQVANAARYRFGDGEPEVCWRVQSPRTLRRIAADPGFMLGQTYMDREWDIVSGDLLSFLELLMRAFPQHNLGNRPARGFGRLLKFFQQWNRQRSSRRNVSRHYDLDESLFRSFLDLNMHYSCAYFADAAMTLEEAQQAKCEHIRRKLALQPGQRVLDIGCGWGGLAMYLAEHAGVSVVGLTLSQEQCRVARERVRERGLDAQVEIKLRDYRREASRFDRVVSVGMFEHVGVPYYSTYFDSVRERLTSEGVALIHTIGRASPPAVTNPWIRRYIFPGGYIPAMSEAMTAVEKSGLICADVEVLRRHYAYTLIEWLKRFSGVRAQVAREKGETFCRMWEFYLATSAASFLWRDLVVFQFQLSRSLDSLPITRDYLYRHGTDGEAPARPDTAGQVRAV